MTNVWIPAFSLNASPLSSGRAPESVLGSIPVSKSLL